MMTLPIYSQNVSAPSSKPTQCVVPCESLRNALLVLEEKKLLDNQLSVVRDSVKILSSVISSQNELIENKTQQINLLNGNLQAQTQIIDENKKMVEEYKRLYKKEKNLKRIGFGTGILGIVLGVLVAL
jgi:hypothetical protein